MAEEERSVIADQDITAPVLKACCSVALAAALSLSGAAQPAHAVGASDARAHERRASEARRKAKDADEEARRLAEEISDLDRRAEAASTKVDELDPLLAAANQRSERVQREVDALAEDASEARARLEANGAEHERQRLLLAERVWSRYRQGNWFYMEVMLDSRDFSDLILRTELVTRVIQSNTRVASDLERTGDELNRAQVLLDRVVLMAEMKRQEAGQVEAQLKQLRLERVGAVRRVEAAKASRANMMANSKRNAKRLRALADAEEAESRRIADELASNSGGSGQYSGKMAWPVPSSHRVTSPYGWRTCPFHGRELHPALDVGAPQGSAIVAAGAGKVIYVGYRGSYGNTVMIDHGDGVVTLYPHQASGAIKVSVGQRVERGERIGGVGSTGNATGPHLHFEVRVNGSPRNPGEWL